MGERSRDATRIRVGPAGWSYKDWAGQVYPKPQPRGFDPLTYLAQYVDAIEAATGARNPRSIWDRIKKEFPILLTKVDEWQFPGAGQRLTPVTNRDGFSACLRPT